MIIQKGPLCALLSWVTMCLLYVLLISLDVCMHVFVCVWERANHQMTHR